MQLAHRHFHELTLQTGVGWSRVLNRYGVVTAPHDAVAAGGRRVYAEKAVDA
jgi:hypothetical protein